MANIRQDNKLEKYYTPSDLINFILDESEKWIDIHNDIDQFLEPASGAGAMIDILKERYNKPVEAYDIFNETLREDIIQSDFLKLKIEYKPKRFTLANPPFNKGTKFLWKCMEVSDYCCFILSASSIANIDWDKVQETFEVNKIQIKKKQQFDRCVTAISIVYLKRK